MTILLESIDISGMSPADFRQLERYMSHIEEEGVYWGNKEQFMKRHKRLKDWINGITERAYSSDYTIPKKIEEK